MNDIFLQSNSQYLKVPFEEFIDAQIMLAGEGLLDIDDTGIDLVLQTPHIYLDSDKVINGERVFTALRNAGLKTTSLTVLPYRYNICASRGTIQRARTIDYYKRAIELCRYVEADYICLTGAGAPYDIAVSELKNNAKENIAALSDYARQMNVEILFGECFGEENLLNAESPVFNHLEEVKEIVNEVSSDSVGAYLDTTLASICGEKIKDWREAFPLDAEGKSKLKLIRLTDGNYNGYRVWGTGVLPCNKFLAEIEEIAFKGPISLQIPGARYADDPLGWDRENRERIQECIDGNHK